MSFKGVKCKECGRNIGCPECGQILPDLSVVTETIGILKQTSKNRWNMDTGELNPPIVEMKTFSSEVFFCTSECRDKWKERNKL